VTACESVIPDLLRRFVATPYQCHVQRGGVDLEVHTNDPVLVSELSRSTGPEPLDPLRVSLFAKIVRDDDAPRDQSEIMTLSSWPLVSVLMGTGTILCLDCERRELLGFIASHVSASDVVSVLLSLAIDLFRTQTPDRRQVSSGGNL
jgi:hypothetical protein